VTCPCHGSQFDVTTGAVRHGPAQEAVRAYRVRVDQDSLQIET
jgi:nitrite reductase/ring-hydroxylating ferredoxin subunit